jgi:hypothetical protein
MEMTMNTKEDEFFFDKLKNHPKLKKRFNDILNVAENTSGELITADEAELKAIEEVRKLGQELMEEWANNQHKKQVEELKKNHPNREKYIKKNSIGKRHLDESN